MELKCKIAKALVYRTKDDAWTIIRGRVYNITPYLSFHPGGEDQLMLGAGKDSTALFGTFFFPFNDMAFTVCVYVCVVDASYKKNRSFGFNRERLIDNTELPLECDLKCIMRAQTYRITMSRMHSQYSKA